MKFPETPSFRLDGKQVLVAGASSGIGLTSAVCLSRAGADVTLVARSASKLEQLVSGLAEEGAQANALPMDITDVVTTRRTIESEGPFDILVNSAGLARHGPASETMPNDFDTVMNLNVRAAYFLTQSIGVGLLNAGKPGSLINISSQMGHVGGIDRATYCASKFAVEGFTKSMAMEWGKANIRVNTVCPTFIRTAFTEQTLSDPKRRDWVNEKIKLPRLAELEDVMGAVLYLASDASSMVTGSSLLVDGGWTAG